MGLCVVEAVDEDEAVLLVEVAGLVARALVDELEGEEEGSGVLCSGGGGDGGGVFEEVGEDFELEFVGEVVVGCWGMAVGVEARRLEWDAGILREGERFGEKEHGRLGERWGCGEDDGEKRAVGGEVWSESSDAGWGRVAWIWLRKVEFALLRVLEAA